MQLITEELSEGNREQIARAYYLKCTTSDKRETYVRHVKKNTKLFQEAMKDVIQKAAVKQGNSRSTPTVVLVYDWDALVNDIAERIKLFLEHA